MYYFFVYLCNLYFFPLLGFFGSAQSLGYFAGPLIAGALEQYLQNPPISNPSNLDPPILDPDYGFRATTFWFCCPYLALVIINSIRLLIKHRSNRRTEFQRREYERI